MGNLVFVPLSDEMLYEHPELIRGRVTAYTPDWRDRPRLGDLPPASAGNDRKSYQERKRREETDAKD